jgi:probable DNA metabolism protein
LERPFEFLKEEKKYQELWKEYYVSASIKSRVNLKAQKNHMPVRYWKHLIEKKV